MGRHKIDRDCVREKKVFIRMTKNEFDQIRQNAQMFGQGNMSRWIRERSLDVSVKIEDEKKEK